VLFDGIALTFDLSRSHLADGETEIAFVTSEASTIDEEIELTSGDEGDISKDYEFYFGFPTLIGNSGSYAFGDVIEIQNSIQYEGGDNYFTYEVSNPTLYREDGISLLDANPVNPTSVIENISGTTTAIVTLQMPLKVFQLNLEKIIIKYTISYEAINPAQRLLTDAPPTIESGTSETAVTVTLKPLDREALEAAGIVTDEQMIANGLDPNDYPRNDLPESSSAENDLSETSSAVMANVAKYLIAATITTATFLG